MSVRQYKTETDPRQGCSLFAGSVQLEVEFSGGVHSWQVVEDMDMVDESVSTLQPRKLKERACEEFKRFVAIVLYLWAVFGLLSIHKSLVLSQHQLDYEVHTFAILNALVFAKVLLVGEELHLGRRFENKPLIYAILHKCFVFTVVLLCFHVIESVAVGVWHGNPIADSAPPMLGWNPKGLLAVGFSCFVLLLPFFGFREILQE